MAQELFQAPIEPLNDPTETFAPREEAADLAIAAHEGVGSVAAETAAPVTGPVTDTNPPVSASTEPINLSDEPIETAEQRAMRLRREENDAKVAAFRDKILEARKPKPEPAPQPVASRILEQTALEMELGRKMNEHHEALRANRPQVVRTKREILAEGSSVPVFRPHNYVPDQRKGQGHIESHTISSN